MVKKNINIDTYTLDLLPIPVILHNGYELVYINKAAKQIFRAPLVIELKLEGLFNETSLKTLRDVFINKKKSNSELSLTTNKSLNTSFNCISRIVTYENKKLIQSIFVSENNEKESTELLNKLGENSKDVIFHIDFSSKNKLQFISESCKKVLGFTANELYSDFSKFKNSIHKDDRKYFISTLNEYIESKKEDKNNTIKIRQGLTKTKHLEISTNPVINNKKQITGIIGNIRDISNAVETEKLLIETKHKFDLITNNANDIIAFFTYEPNPAYIYVSPNITNILGYKPEELQNESSFFANRLISGQEKFKHFVDLLKTNQKKGIKKDIHFSFNIYNKSGESVWIENNLVPIINSRGKIDFYINILRDITEQKLAEIEVENQYINYRNLLDNSPAAYIIHHHGICLYLNNALLKILKYKSKSDLLGKFIVDFFDENDRKRAINRIKEIYTNKGTGNKLSSYNVKDRLGNTIEVEIKSGFIKFNNKDCVISLVDNISEKRQKEKEKLKAQVTAVANIQLQKEIKERMVAEKNLREKTAHLSAIFESSTHLIWSVNKNFELTSFNQNFYGIVKNHYGIRVKSGIRIDELLSKDRESYINYWYPKYSEVFAGRKLEFEKEDLFEGKIFRKVFINPIYNNENVVSEISCIANDITDSKIYEQKLLNQSGKLSAIFDSSHHYIWTIDREGKLTSFNKNYYDLVTSIYNTKPFLGLELNRGVLANDKEYNELLEFHYEKAFSGLATSFEIETRDKDFKNVHLEIFFNPIYQNQEVVEVSGIAHNITEKKLVQQRIELSLKEKEVLLKEVHHRVKNNMQVISSILNLQSSYVSDEYALALLQESQNRIKTMAYIHESLYQNKSFTSVNFSEYIQTLINNIIQSYTYSADKIKLILNIEPLTLSLDSSIPAGLIINELTTNAIKHAFPERKTGIITFNLSYKNKFVILELKDNGVGFAPGVDFTNSHSLGLQLVNTLIEQLGGKLKFKSQKGKGTEVSVIFKL